MKKVNAFESRGLIPGRTADSAENYGVTKWPEKDAVRTVTCRQWKKTRIASGQDERTEAEILCVSNSTFYVSILTLLLLHPQNERGVRIQIQADSI